MSITGSLVGYENNNEVNSKSKKRRSILLHSTNNCSITSSMGGKNCPPSSLNSSISNSIITTTSSSLSQQQQQQQQSHHHQHQHQHSQQQLQQKYMNSKRKHAKYSSMHQHPLHMDHNNYLHLNSLWSIWYGVLLTLFQGYLAVHGAYRFLGCSLISWKIEPVAELNLQIVLSGVVFILLPLFFTSAVFKVGNLANDGIKLATNSRQRHHCSMSPHDGLEEEARGGTLRALWTHGGPTAAFVHIVIAMCLLLPRLLLEARIIENGLLPRENIWQTELDFIAVNRRNLVVLSVITAPYQNITNISDDLQPNTEEGEEDYYNDTMFTAIGNSNSINNNLLELDGGTSVDRGDGNSQPKGAGKTRYFEVPDLINTSNNDRSIEDSIMTASEGRGEMGGSIEEIYSNEFPGIKSINPTIQTAGGTAMATETQASATTTTTITTTTTTTAGTSTSTSSTSSSSSSTTASTTSSSSTANNRLQANKNKSYDKTWDKLATLSKGNRLSGVTTSEDVDGGGGDSGEATTRASTPTTTTKSMLTTSQMTAAAPVATKTTNRMPSAPAKTMASSAEATSTTTAISSEQVYIEPTTRTQTTTNQQQQQHHHHHQQHHHNQHHHNQQNEHHQQHSSNKSSRKHGNRQHHRQRNQNNRRQHHHQHHQHHNHHHQQQHSHTTSTMASITIGDSSGRSVEQDRSSSGTFAENTIYPSKSSNARDLNSEEDLDYGRRYGAQPKSTSTISTTTRDSNIHIVKPEKLPEIIPSTPVSSNSKIIEIKTKQTKQHRMKRMADEELQVEIEPEYLIGDFTNANTNNNNNNNDSNENISDVASEYGTADASPSSSSPLAIDTSTLSTSSSAAAAVNVDMTSQQQESGVVRLDGFAGMLQIFFGIEKPIDVDVFAHPPSAEFVNLLFALLVWCVRYPAVFWTTTKAFGTIFSIQMITAAMDIIFSYIGISNLYKLQVYSEAMPIQNPGLILNGVVTLALFLLSSILMIASSMIMYLYGHGRLAAKMRDRSLITMKASESWIYFAHCASLCYVLALAVVKAPLLNDLSATYRSNLHCPTFLSALISVVHILMWIVIWLGLTAKRRWTFKLPPIDTYGLSKATTQPLLMANRGSIPSAQGSGGSGSGSSVGGGGGGGKSICGNETKIGNDRSGSGNIGGSGCGGGGGIISTTSSIDGGTEDIYWPKLTPSSPKLKVTFNEVTSTCDDDVLLIGDHEQTDGKRNSPRGTAVCFTSITGEIDEGEYATLRTATAATVVGIGVGAAINNSAGGGRGSRGGDIRGGNTSPITINTSSISIIGSTKIFHLSEYDELPPPPPPQLMTSLNATTTTTVTISTTTTTTTLLTTMTNNNVTTSNRNSISGIVGDYANCGIISTGDDNISEEGKLLACVRDDSVTYASTRDLDPPPQSTPAPPPPPPPPPLQNDGSNDHSPTQLYGNCGIGVGRAPQAMPEIMQLSSSPEHLVSPLAPVTVTVHTNEAHIASSSTPRCLRRADSGVPQEALTPRSDTTSTTESTTSPPERAPSESSSGVHSGEERDVEVVIRPRVACKPPPKPPQPAIQEEPYGRCTNMRMSSFAVEPARHSSSATLPLQRNMSDQRYDYTHCNTMPLPVGCHSQQQQQQQLQQELLQQQQLNSMSISAGGYASTSAHSMQSQLLPAFAPPLQSAAFVSSFKTQMYANSAVAMAGANAARMQQQQQLLQLQQQQQQQQQQSSQPLVMHTTLPNGVRYSNPHFLRRLPHVSKAAESPYGHLGIGAGHHTFSKLLHDPLQNSLATTCIPEDRDSANYSMSSDQECNLYATANHMN